MHVTGMTIQGIPPFWDTVDFEFDNRVNLFVGPNASGKSVALRLLLSRTLIPQRFYFDLSDDWNQILLNEVQVRRMQHIEAPEEGQKDGVNFVPWTYVPAGRVNLPFSDDNKGMSDLAAEGVSRIFIEEEIEEQQGRISPINLRNLLRDPLYAFDGRRIHRAYKLISDRIRMQRASSDNITVYQSAELLASKCAQSICSEVLTPGAFPADYIHRQMVQNDTLTPTNVHDQMGIRTTDDAPNGLFMGDLSSGTQGTLLWIWYLALRLADFHHRSRGNRPNLGQFDWAQEPGVLLVDEIENHLHPTWQRRVIPALRKHFPNLQIFATTHSPFVVAGLEKGQVHMLKRRPGGMIAASTNEHDIIGWTTDEILRTFMGVDEPTDQLTIDRRQRLLELRRKDSLTDEEAAEMEDLRRQVNEDFLSSSTPLEAQRERYGDMMLEFLRSRQSELSQDGS